MRKQWLNLGIIWIYLGKILSRDAEVVSEQLDLQREMPKEGEKEQEIQCLNTQIMEMNFHFSSL